MSFINRRETLKISEQQDVEHLKKKKSVKKVVFVFPDVPHVMSGGLKMVFEYANRLTARKYEVQIAFDCREGIYNKRLYIPLFFKKYILYPLLIRWYPRWFALRPSVKKLLLKNGICDEEMPNADAVIATAVKTAEPVARLTASKGKKIYFIQDFENWSEDWSENKVKKTYHLGLTNIVIAKWLKKILQADGASCVVIPNGIDFNIFNIDTPISKRKQHVVSMLYHKQPHKGAKYGVSALFRLKEKYPDLKAYLFGVPSRPVDLPKWVIYTQNATPMQLRKIYNSSLVYLCPSLAEGFGLTGAEAMACGAAYVASDYGGVHEYAEDGRNVLLSAPRDVDGLVNHVSYLFDHPEERIQLAETGYQDIHQLDWEKSLDKFEEILQS